MLEYVEPFDYQITNDHQQRVGSRSDKGSLSQRLLANLITQKVLEIGLLFKDNMKNA